jgi:cytidylate kinase
MIITIDGPVATGKSTVAKKLAARLGFIYFDTGAMYRCLTYALMQRGINLDDRETLLKFLSDFTFDIKQKGSDKQYFVRNEEVTTQIRGQAVTALVSKVAAIPEVRESLVKLQRAWGTKGVNAVFEGRDLGTVVFPHADLKIFLSGNLEIRAQRRLEEWKTKFPKEADHLTLQHMKQEIENRDMKDSTRVVSPLKCAEDAYVVDTSNLSVDQVVDEILARANSL